MSNSFANPWTVARQALLSMDFPRQEFQSPGNLPDPGIEPKSPALAGRFITTKPPGRPYLHFSTCLLYPYLESNTLVAFWGTGTNMISKNKQGWRESLDSSVYLAVCRVLVVFPATFLGEVGLLRGIWGDGFAFWGWKVALKSWGSPLSARH